MSVLLQSLNCEPRSSAQSQHEHGFDQVAEHEGRLQASPHVRGHLNAAHALNEAFVAKLEGHDSDEQLTASCVQSCCGGLLCGDQVLVTATHSSRGSVQYTDQRTDEFESRQEAAKEGWEPDDTSTRPPQDPQKYSPRSQEQVKRSNSSVRAHSSEEAQEVISTGSGDRLKHHEEDDNSLVARQPVQYPSTSPSRSIQMTSRKKFTQGAFRPRDFLIPSRHDTPPRRSRNLIPPSLYGGSFNDEATAPQTPTGCADPRRTFPRRRTSRTESEPAHKRPRLDVTPSEKLSVHLSASTANDDEDELASNRHDENGLSTASSAKGKNYNQGSLNYNSHIVEYERSESTASGKSNPGGGLFQNPSYHKINKMMSPASSSGQDDARRDTAIIDDMNTTESKCQPAGKWQRSALSPFTSHAKSPIRATTTTRHTHDHSRRSPHRQKEESPLGSDVTDRAKAISPEHPTGDEWHRRDSAVSGSASAHDDLIDRPVSEQDLKKHRLAQQGREKTKTDQDRANAETSVKTRARESTHRGSSLYADELAMDILEHAVPAQANADFAVRKSPVPSTSKSRSSHGQNPSAADRKAAVLPHSTSGPAHFEMPDLSRMSGGELECCTVPCQAIKGSNGFNRENDGSELLIFYKKETRNFCVRQKSTDAELFNATKYSHVYFSVSSAETLFLTEVGKGGHLGWTWMRLPNKASSDALGLLVQQCTKLRMYDIPDRKFPELFNKIVSTKPSERVKAADRLEKVATERSYSASRKDCIMTDRESIRGQKHSKLRTRMKNESGEQSVQSRRTGNTPPQSLLRGQSSTSETFSKLSNKIQTVPATRAVTRSEKLREIASENPAPIESSTVTRYDDGKRWTEPLVYPSTGANRATVDYDDLQRLDDDELLNDNLISFAIKYEQERMGKQRDNVFIFNTYFYGRLKEGDYDAVKRWTSKVDIFSYRYVVVPINENLHWYLAVICNVHNIQLRKIESQHEDRPEGNQGLDSAVRRLRSVSGSRSHTEYDHGPQTTTQHHLEGRNTESRNREPSTAGPSPLKVATQTSGRGKNIGGLARKSESTKAAKAIQPCILTLDSLGQSHALAVRKLKDYLMAEAKAKKQSTVESVLKGVTAKDIPLQPNYSDCGIYLTSYINKFMKDPEWFVKKVVTPDSMKDEHWKMLVASAQRKNLRDRIHRVYKKQLAGHEGHSSDSSNSETSRGGKPAASKFSYNPKENEAVAVDQRNIEAESSSDDIIEDDDEATHVDINGLDGGANRLKSEETLQASIADFHRSRAGSSAQGALLAPTPAGWGGSKTHMTTKGSFADVTESQSISDDDEESSIAGIASNLRHDSDAALLHLEDDQPRLLADLANVAKSGTFDESDYTETAEADMNDVEDGPTMSPAAFSREMHQAYQRPSRRFVDATDGDSMDDSTVHSDAAAGRSGHAAGYAARRRAISSSSVSD